jgi:hypothetical protein
MAPSSPEADTVGKPEFVADEVERPEAADHDRDS